MDLAKQLRVERARHDIVWFSQYYLGAYFNVATPHFAKELDATYLAKQNSLTLIAIGHGKSTRLSFLHPLHAICMDPNTRIILASKTLDRAIEFVSRLGKELRNNRRLVRDFGPFYTGEREWSTAKFTVRRSKNLREPTVTATGLGGAIEGLRVDYIIADDVLDIEHQTSEVERDRAKTWFDETLYGRLEPGGLMEVIGTPWHTDDLYAHIEKKAGFSCRRYPAIVNEETHEVLWPERWSWEELMRRKENMGTIAFKQKYMVDPRAFQGNWFKPGWIKWEAVPPPLRRIVCGWDLNLSAKEMSDYSVGIVMGTDAKGDFHVLDMFRDHLQSGHHEQIISLYNKHVKPDSKPERVGIETNMFQNLVYQSVAAAAPTVPLTPLYRIKDKGQRILAIQPYFEQGRVYVNSALPQRDAFVEELLSFPDGVHDDTLDALEVCFNLLGSASIKLLRSDALDRVLG